MDERRLQIEEQEMGRLFTGFSLCEDDDGECYWEGSIGGFSFIITYPEDYPISPPSIQEDNVPIEIHRFTNGHLCVLKPSEWSPDFTVATMVGILMRFVHDYQRGLL